MENEKQAKMSIEDEIERNGPAAVAARLDEEIRQFTAALEDDYDGCGIDMALEYVDGAGNDAVADTFTDLFNDLEKTYGDCDD